jgi:AcrR family transcriptional regulator
VTLRGIATEAGVALSQLNYYYGNKDSLFAAVAKHMQEKYIAALDERLRDDDTLEAQVLAFVDHNESFLKSSPDTYRNYLEFSTFAMTSREFQKKIADFTSEVVAVMENRAARSHPNEKVAGAFSVAEIARYILSVTLGIALQHFLSPDDSAVLKGFDAIRATVTQRIEQNRVARPEC